MTQWQRSYNKSSLIYDKKKMGHLPKSELLKENLELITLIQTP